MVRSLLRVKQDKADRVEAVVFSGMQRPKFRPVHQYNKDVAGLEIGGFLGSNY